MKGATWGSASLHKAHNLLHAFVCHQFAEAWLIGRQVGIQPSDDAIGIVGDLHHSSEGYSDDRGFHCAIAARRGLTASLLLTSVRNISPGRGDWIVKCVAGAPLSLLSFANAPRAIAMLSNDPVCDR